MKIAITVDTEFSINGAFRDTSTFPAGKERVLCPVNGVPQGLPFILESLSRYGAKATFFIEALQRAYFPTQEMGVFIPPILQDGHEIGLHLHPCWLNFQKPNWREYAKRFSPHDHCDAMSDAELDYAFGFGLESLAEIGAPKPQSVRTGSLRCSSKVYSAAARHGINIASNLGIGYCRPAEQELHLYGGHKQFHGVTELPVLTFKKFNRFKLQKEKILTITGTSFILTRYLLEQAHKAGYEHIVLLTHPFEFIEPRNRERLVALCAYIAENSEIFSFATISECAAAVAGKPAFTPAPIEVSFRMSCLNMIDNHSGLGGRLSAISGADHFSAGQGFGNARGTGQRKRQTV